MSILPRPSSPKATARPSAVAALVLAAGLALAGCSSARETQHPNASWAGAQPVAPPPQKQAAYVAEPGDPIKEAPIEPRRPPQATPDDPNEPFSPNYGGPRSRPPVRVGEATVPVAQQPPAATLPVVERRLPEPSRAYFRKVTTAAAD